MIYSNKMGFTDNIFFFAILCIFNRFAQEYPEAAAKLRGARG